ncbi:MAG: hypothetical protein WC099_01075 [Candidatus Paceibacterota bacterium]
MSTENGGSTKSTKIVTGVVAVIVIIIIALFVFLSPSSPESTTDTTNPATEDSALPPENASTTGGAAGGAFGDIKDVDKIYEIKMDKGAFSPVSTVVSKGAVARIAFSAIDGDYNVSFASPIDMNINLKKGQAALVPFDAQKNESGEYAFTSKDAEGKTMTGKIVIK